MIIKWFDQMGNIENKKQYDYEMFGLDRILRIKQSMIMNGFDRMEDT